MIRIRLVIFHKILKALLRKASKPSQRLFWCIVSRETGVSYPVIWVYRIPCPGVSYPVKYGKNAKILGY